MSGPPNSIGPYIITRETGRGGMGVVYLARDTKLDRDVAIKALPPEVAEDKERLERFEREAKLLASLNHPHIATIHGLEEANGNQYLVLEYIDGESFEARLDRGAIPVAEALPIAKQIAEAIEAAHEKGVIHRDLKPANIKFTADGEVKVLDFGLAKAMEADAASSSAETLAHSPTLIGSPTVQGVILGTAGYMSPEQARGKPVDKRSDIFSFGTILFEMLTGRQLFPGEAITESLGAIIHKDPDWSALPSNTPPTIQLLLRRCLAKDRKRRLHDIADARVEVEDAISDPSSSSLGLAAAAIAEPATHHRPRRWLTAILLVAMAGVAATATWFATSSLRRPASPPLQLVIPSQTNAYKFARNMIISPDGTQVAFEAFRSNNTDAKRVLWVRRLDEFDAQELGPETTGDLFWSPDSRYIGFHADGKLWSIRVDGADKRLLASLGANDGATWNADGVIVIAATYGLGLQILRPGTASLEPLTSANSETIETHHLYPHFLPDGNRYLYLEVTFDPEQEIRTRSLYAGDLATGEQSLIGPFTSNTWYVDSGYLVYVEDGNVKAVPFDTNRMRITGKPSIIAQDAKYQKYFGQSMMSASRNGVVVFSPVNEQQRLVWFDADGRRLGQVGAPATFDAEHRISPDGQTVAAAIYDPRTELSDIVLYGLQNESSYRLTVDARWEGQPVWSPDGSTIFFSTDHHGSPDVYSIEVGGDGTFREVFRELGAWFPSDVTPDGRFLSVWRHRDNSEDDCDL